MSTNIKTNKVNYAMDNALEFDSSNSLDNDTVKDPLPIVTIILRGSKNYIQTLNSGLTYLWESGSISSIINYKHKTLISKN